MGWMLGALAAVVLVAHGGAGAARAAELPANDYPTVARADYVFGCMRTNGETRQAMGDLCKANLDSWFAEKKVLTLIPELI